MSAPSDIYLTVIDRVAARVASWSATDQAVAIPTCPGWTAHDLVAHLAGGAADHATGRLDGFPGPAWTSRHVAERSSRSTQDVLAELLALAPQTAARCDQRPTAPNSSWDAYIHERDLAAAFDGEPSSLDDHGHQLLRDMIAFIAGHAPFEIATERVGDAVRLAVVARERYVATIPAAAAFRGVTGRATPDDMRGWAWTPTTPPAPVLDQLSLF